MTRTLPIAALALLPCLAFAQDSSYSPKGQLIPAPASASAHEAWLKDVTHWRAERLIRIGYDGSRYGNPATRWTQSSFLQPQMMVHDRYFYDPLAGRYTVDRYLDDLEKRYGGIDSVLIWPTYPNMGIDSRNQHDMLRSMPGGVEGVRAMVADFHRRGVKVLFPMMMWDQGTRPPEMPWPEAIAQLMKEIGADGINGDTQDGVPLAFSQAADHTGHPLVFEPEGGPADEALAWNLMTWGQYGGQFNFLPGIDRYRWLEPRHMVHISDRWNRARTNNLQFAFLNGEGWESWENIWGIWNGLTARDAEATRRMATLERGVAKYLVSPGWEPLYPMQRYGVFSSRWPLEGSAVWTIVNRNEYDVEGRQMRVPEGMRYFDLYHGVELKPDAGVLSFPLEAHGYGAVLATAGEPAAELRQLMQRMHAMTAKPLAAYLDVWQHTVQALVDIALTQPALNGPDTMVRVPGGKYVFQVEGIEIEGSNDIGVDFQYPWENSARRYHEQAMEIRPFYIDRFPVTNEQYKKFVDASGYRPKDTLNYLKDWEAGTYPAGWAKKPVTWVSLEDARAYAKWAGKRLPHEWEWQFAAQGTDGRVYPWGNDWRADAVPAPDQSRQMRAADDVDSHPAGASPFGVMDLVGNVWQWTDEYVDEHTRAAVLRGGSHYQPQGSMWYFPQAYRNNQHGKYLLMAPGYDRSGGLGFRCVVDAR